MEIFKAFGKVLTVCWFITSLVILLTILFNHDGNVTAFCDATGCNRELLITVCIIPTFFWLVAYFVTAGFFFLALSILIFRLVGWAVFDEEFSFKNLI